MNTVDTKPLKRRTRKLGKAQERRLYAALSTDDLLYRKFERMNQKLLADAERLLVRPRRVVRVLGVHGDLSDRLMEELQIVHVDVTPDGTFVVVRLPPASRQKPKRAKSKKAPPKEPSSQATIKPPPGFSMGAMKNDW